jgi:hypothetical protein
MQLVHKLFSLLLPFKNLQNPFVETKHHVEQLPKPPETSDF